MGFLEEFFDILRAFSERSSKILEGFGGVLVGFGGVFRYTRGKVLQNNMYFGGVWRGLERFWRGFGVNCNN